MVHTNPDKINATNMIVTDRESLPNSRRKAINMNGRSVGVLLLVTLVTFAEGAKILGVIPTVGKSHYIIGAAYMKTLVEAGHEVTVISPFPLKNPPKNYRNIELTEMEQKLSTEQEQNLFNFKGSGSISFLFLLHIFYGQFSDLVCKFVLHHPNVVDLLNSNEKFDLVIVESIISESLYGFAQHFDAPLITFSTFGNSMWTNDLVGTPAPTSHVAHFMLSLTDHMSFWERFLNTVVSLVDRAYYELVYLPKQNRYYDEAFPNARITFDQQMNNVSLVFLNQHFSMSSPRPYPPNMVEVGGLQVEKEKPLPKDLQKYLDEATDGVIYFCMGSNLKSIHFPEEKRNAFLNVFSKMKQRVLWKFEDETIPNQPANLMIKSWMPQNDILAHPNVKLFITHGGLLGSTESLYHGKPMVGIPIFGDQMMNVGKAVRAGYAVLLEYDDINEVTISDAINTVLNDPSYDRNVKVNSERFRDKPMTPQQTVVYWVEYVIRHGGAPQLRSPAMELSLLQYLLIDVYAVLFAVLGAVAIVNLYIARKIFRKVFKPNGKSRKKKRS